MKIIKVIFWRLKKAFYALETLRKSKNTKLKLKAYKIYFVLYLCFVYFTALMNYLFRF